MSTSYNKREVEKKKAQKKRDKQKRKDERRSNGPSSMDDMIAYVDENGNLCDTPPEVTASEEIDPTTIQTSVPRREDTEEMRPTGRIDFFDDKKGFGFIVGKDIERLFFHVSNAPADIQTGEQVTFDIARDDRGLSAIRVERVKPTEE